MGGFMKRFALSALLVLSVYFSWFSASTALAAPTAFQCPIPTQTVGTAGLRIPAPLPKSGDLVINFQRSGADSTQATINFSEIKDATLLMDRIAKTINDESSQRGPKMASVRERGLDEIKTFSTGAVIGLAVIEVFRFLMVYDPDQVQVNFQTPSNYSINCDTLGPLREVPDLTNIAFTSKPKVLFVAAPEKFTSDQPTQIAVAFSDREDDVGSIDVAFRSKDNPRNRGSGGLGFQTLPIPSPFGAGLKAVKFKLTVQCESPETFEATVTANDIKSNISEPVTVTFACGN